MTADSLSYDEDFLYDVLRNKDRRFDGRVFFGAASTKIYCRPVCPARPKRENCRFFASAAEAESQGFRPCLRCRPELAPDYPDYISPGGRLAFLAALELQSGASAERAAASLGVSELELTQALSARYGASPAQYIQTSGLLLARRARESGGDSAVLSIPCRQPYAWRELLDFLTPRVIAGVEEAKDGTYRRVVSLSREGENYAGWTEISYDEKKFLLRAQVSLSLLPVLRLVNVRLKRMFDTDFDPEAAEGLGELAESAGLAKNSPGLRVPGCFDAFEMGVRAILGQQVTVKAAHTIVTRVAEALGEDIATPFPALRRLFPSPRKILETSDDALGRMGIVKSRQRALHALAEFAMAGGLEPKADVEGQIAELKKLPGIGDWTAQYLALRALCWTDAFPCTDYAVKAAMENKPTGEILRIAERWRPWRAYAAMYLWRKMTMVV